MEQLGLPKGTQHFWIEIEARLPEVSGNRYPYTLFHSVSPGTTAHMFGNCRIERNMKTEKQGGGQIATFGKVQEKGAAEQ